MLPLLDLLLIVEEDIGLGRVGGSSDTNPIGTPVLHLPIRPRLDAADKVLDGLEVTPVAQEQVGEARKPPVVIHRLPGTVLAP